jgi:putative endonuclease
LKRTRRGEPSPLYLLVCRDGRTYAGIATDIAARFAAHSGGKGAKFTRSNPPVRVLGAQAFASKSEALKAEAALKKLEVGLGSEMGAV